MIPPEEYARIITVARQHGIDTRFLAAIRQTENGSPGREFGIMIPGENRWDLQAADAARTVRHTVGRLWKALDADAWDDVTGRYSDLFVRYFSRGGPGYDGYAHVPAPGEPALANDPKGLNKNHYTNLSAFYRIACT